VVVLAWPVMIALTAYDLFATANRKQKAKTPATD